MTNVSVQSEIERIEREKDAQIEALRLALSKQAAAEYEAQQLIEKNNGITTRRQRRQTGVDWFEQQRRPHHEESFAQLGNQLNGWRAEFIEALTNLYRVAGEYTDHEKNYEQAMIALLSDILIAAENDTSLGVGYANVLDEARVISQVAGFSDPFTGLDKESLKFAGVRSDLARQPSPIYEWQRKAEAGENVARLTAILNERS